MAQIPAPTEPNGPTPIEQDCRVCGCRDRHPRYSLREMMFGSREAFTYLRCTACGTLQIEEVPSDLQRFYPPAYYSFSGEDPVPPSTPWQRWLARTRVGPQLFGRRRRLRRLGKEFDRRVAPPPVYDGLVRPIAARATLVGFDDPILDVGCGSRPARLAAFRAAGFRGLLGIDPFIERDTTYHGIPILRRSLAEVEGQFGLVMFHHSFEHVPDPVEVMADAARLLRSGGSILIRMPVMESAMWERYGVDWIELDAPRHLYLFTRAGLAMLAERHGLAAAGGVPDSKEWEFIGSEQCRRDLAMFEPGSWFVDPAASGWAEDDLAAFTAEARRLNAEGRSGRAGFWFRKT